MDFRHIGGGIQSNPFGQFLILDRVGAGSKDVMEELESVIGFQKTRRHFKGIEEALFVVMKMWTPVRGVVIFFGLLETDDPFCLFQAFCISGVLKLPLIAESDLIHHVVEVFDDVEGINADPGIREVLFWLETKPLFISQQKYFTCFPVSFAPMRTGGSTCSDRHRRSDRGHR